MAHRLPGTRRLLWAWAILMALTVLSMLGASRGLMAETASLRATALVVIVMATWFKAHRIVMVYLNLRESTSAWRGALNGFLFVSCLIILGAGATLFLAAP